MTEDQLSKLEEAIKAVLESLIRWVENLDQEAINEFYGSLIKLSQSFGLLVDTLKILAAIWVANKLFTIGFLAIDRLTVSQT